MGNIKFISRQNNLDLSIYPSEKEPIWVLWVYTQGK
jgi:hypothetical protein